MFGYINIKGVTTLLYLPPGVLWAQGLCSAAQAQSWQGLVMSWGIRAWHTHLRLIAAHTLQSVLGQNLPGALVSPASGSDVDLGVL